MEEIMSKEEYLKAMAERLLRELRKVKFNIHAAVLGDGNEENSLNRACVDIIRCLGIEGHDGEINAIDNNDLDGAYEEYISYEQPLHDYEVNISVNYDTTIHVKAANEDEAREYVSDNLYTNGNDLYMDDDENVIEDFDTQFGDTDWCVESARDCGEYEE